MKKILFGLFCFFFVTNCYADTPQFKKHVMNIDTSVNNNFCGETYVPISIDYDNDGDMDVLIVERCGQVIILENMLK
jgi:hypothetical protein